MTLIVMLGGCSADVPLNPSFPLTLSDAREAMVTMREDPRPLARPVVVLAGIYDPGFVSTDLARQIRESTTTPELVISVSFFTSGSFDSCRDRVIDAIELAFPNVDQTLTTEVDVVAVSMGGLVARHAARSRDEESPRLNIARLFTISTPHRGAKMAWVPSLDSRVADMRHDAPFISGLNNEESPYELFPYTRLGDAIVGEENTAPPGQNPWWIANIPGGLSHMLASTDPRLIADILRRLRGETAFAQQPRHPLPSKTGQLTGGDSLAN